NFILGGTVVSHVNDLTTEKQDASPNLTTLSKVTPGPVGLAILADANITVATAQAYSPDIAPDYIRTAGYTDAGDGGGALYKQVASEPSHAGKFSITLSDGVTVVWYEIAEAVLRPEMFGAVGDYDYSTETGTEDGPAFAGMLAAMQSGQRISLDAKKYLISSTLSVTAKDLFMEGCGSASTHLVFNDCDGITLDQSDHAYREFEFRGISFVTNAEKTRNGVSYIGAPNTGDSGTRRFIECRFIGADRVLTPSGAGPYTEGWENCVD